LLNILPAVDAKADIGVKRILPSSALVFREGELDKSS
jgi:hypothetical protein